MRRRRRATTTKALGVVLPAHDEQELLVSALEALGESLEDARLFDVTFEVVVVLDSCLDLSERLVVDWRRRLARRGAVRVVIITSDARNVGHARALGCARVLEDVGDLDPASVWLATTDADSRVPRRWLRAQLLAREKGFDAWAGRVRVADWSSRHRVLRTKWLRDYERERHPIHGANMGFSGSAYLAAGGFASLRTGEDRALVRVMEAQGARCCYDESLRVVTSARRVARAPGGFAYALNLAEGFPGAD